MCFCLSLPCPALPCLALPLPPRPMHGLWPSYLINPWFRRLSPSLISTPVCSMPLVFPYYRRPQRRLLFIESLRCLLLPSTRPVARQGAQTP
ncbi:hypothetical protein IWZ01DRAFT_356303 [Phyllosticta capitalensis]